MWTNGKIVAILLIVLVLTIRRTSADGDAHQKPIDLLKLVNPAKDAINGKWSMDNGALTTTAEGLANLEFQYAPPTEYDYRVVVVVKAQQDALMLICCGNGHQFSWVLNENSCGFSSVNGKGAAAKGNATVNRNTRLAIGGKYTTVVKVRKDGISAYLDDALVSTLKTDFSNLSLLKAHTLRRNDTIGLSTNRDAIRFESVEVIAASAGLPSGDSIAASTMPSAPTADVSTKDIADYRQQKLKPVLDQIQSLEPLIAMLPKTPNRPVSDLENRLAEARADQKKILAQSDDSLASEIRENRAIAAAQAEEQRIAFEKKRARAEEKSREKELLHDQAVEAAAKQLAAVRQSKWPGWNGPWKQCPLCGGTGIDEDASRDANTQRASAAAAQMVGGGQIVKGKLVAIPCALCGGTGQVPDR